MFFSCGVECFFKAVVVTIFIITGIFFLQGGIFVFQNDNKFVSSLIFRSQDIPIVSGDLFGLFLVSPETKSNFSCDYYVVGVDTVE